MFNLKLYVSVDVLSAPKKHEFLVRLRETKPLTDAIPLVLQAVRSSLDTTRQIPSDLKCLQAWMSHIPSS
jgi:hypothetical protein